ncbi:MAG: alanine racemase, partial [Bacillota bacterium]|nr:alanine racemase [Bacillota bacterium]
LGEAEVMAAAGVKGIMIANEIVGSIKTRRLAALCRQSPVIVAVDSLDNARELAGAAREVGSTIRVVIEVDLGSKRAGVQPGQMGLELAREITGLDGLKFVGVMGWEGHTRRVKDPVLRKQAVEQSVGLLVETARLCRASGIPVEIVSCGGTGTEEFSSLVPGVTEIQAGGIVFNDVFYMELGVKTEPALTVLSTVSSRPAPATVTTDAGKKTMSMDVAFPRPLGLEAAAVRLSAEHSTIDLKEPSDLRAGDKVEWLVGYADTTVHLHDEVYGIRNGRVETVWAVAGRGKTR